MLCTDLAVWEKAVIDSRSALEFLRCYFFDMDSESPLLLPGFGVCCLVLPGGSVELMVVSRRFQ